MSELGKPFLKNKNKNWKKKKINVKMPHVNKKPYQKEKWFKPKNRPRMNYEWIGKIKKIRSKKSKKQ